MSPAAKKKKDTAPKPSVVKGKNGRQVTVERRADGMVAVTWLCGAVRTFAEDELRAAIEHFELVTLYGSDVWFEDEDTNGSCYGARLDDDRFHAADRGADEDSGDVPWKTFKAALEKQLAAKP